MPTAARERRAASCGHHALPHRHSRSKSWARNSTTLRHADEPPYHRRHPPRIGRTDGAARGSSIMTRTASSGRQAWAFVEDCRASPGRRPSSRFCRSIDQLARRRRSSTTADDFSARPVPRLLHLIELQFPKNDGRAATRCCAAAAKNGENAAPPAVLRDQPGCLMICSALRRRHRSPNAEGGLRFSARVHLVPVFSDTIFLRPQREERPPTTATANMLEFRR